MSRGTCARVRPRAGLARIRFNGGFTFAEQPDRAAPAARIIWHADLDPGTIGVAAVPADPSDPDSLRIDQISSWLAMAVDAEGREHICTISGSTSRKGG